MYWGASIRYSSPAFYTFMEEGSLYVLLGEILQGKISVGEMYQ